jgi:hypothetical protein
METDTPRHDDDTHIPETPTEADETPDEQDAPTTPSPDADPDRTEESPATQSGGPGEATGPDPAGLE